MSLIFFAIIIWVFVNVVKSSKAKKEQEEKRRAALRNAERRAYSAPPAAPTMSDAERQRRAELLMQELDRVKDMNGSEEDEEYLPEALEVAEAERREKQRRLKAELEARHGRVCSHGASLEGQSAAHAPLTAATATVKAHTEHVVTPMTESAHTHTESSISGIRECAPESAPASPYAAANASAYAAASACAADASPRAPSAKGAATGNAKPAASAYAVRTETESRSPVRIPLGINDVARGILYAEILGKPKALASRK